MTTTQDETNVELLSVEKDDPATKLPRERAAPSCFNRCCPFAALAICIALFASVPISMFAVSFSCKSLGPTAAIYEFACRSNDTFDWTSNDGYPHVPLEPLIRWAPGIAFGAPTCWAAYESQPNNQFVKRWRCVHAATNVSLARPDLCYSSRIVKLKFARPQVFFDSFAWLDRTRDAQYDRRRFSPGTPTREYSVVRVQ